MTTLAQQNGLKETCVCGNDRASHYLETDGTVGACLCANCPCRKYEDVNAPPTLRPKAPLAALYVPLHESAHRDRPHADKQCSCYSCQEWDRKAKRRYSNWGP